MPSFKNMKIVYKVVSLLGLLGLVAVVTTFFATTNMHGIDSTYTTLIDGDAKGAVAVSRINTRVIDTGRLNYQMIAESDPAKMQAVSAEIDANRESLLKQAQQAKARLPRWSSELAEIMSDYDAVFQISKEIRDIAATNDDAKALAVTRERFQPAMTALRTKTNKLVDGVGADLDKVSADASETTKVTVYVTYGAVGAGLVAVMALAVFLTNTGVARPIVEIDEVMRRLADRDYTAEVRGLDRHDEVGAMAKAVQVFKSSMIKADELAAKEEQARREREQRTRRIEELTRDFDAAVDEMLNSTSVAAGELQTTASSMSATAEQTMQQAGSVAAAAEQASANVQTVAAASEELASSINEISRQVTQSSKVAADAAIQSKRTDDMVQGLAQSAQRIGDVIKLINDIAGQTNLLALNATIEAARAGEAGKGFAVVAGEVKNLANQTGKATEEIAQQVSAVQSATQQAVQAIQQIGATISEINQISTTIASAVEEQGAATREIARNVNEASVGTNEVTKNIGGVTDAAGTTGRAATDVLATSSKLAGQADKLKQVVQAFLEGVRTA
ncbi:methyl-accepting chemotaxis protein [Telmatospirillum sp.]|uniref:methyl-accepting chemotaxis protein n=1 Tax=Telmatospirillum sp. TaxID=2079197 RepID=UPI00283D9C34|nr:methyl-accepting chemotaxis protein [Telmatospirillum sp.]MDR3438140.1 methyl-accepting chemotaxis protein [Telmatospirillum sp.]